MGKFSEAVKTTFMIMLMLVLIFTYANVGTAFLKILGRINLLEGQVALVNDAQRELYQQIAQCIVREAQMNNTFKNYVISAKDVIVAQADLTAALTDKLQEIEKSLSAVNADKALIKGIADFRERKVEMKILQSVIYITNYTRGTLGSGTTLKYKGKYYILSAAHLVGSMIDDLRLSENGETIDNLEIVKINKDTDLVLFRCKSPDIQPRIFAELADKEPGRGEELFLCGNPSGIEDVLSTGRVIRLAGNTMFVQDHCYFGSSGGGAFNKEGNIVGVISFISIKDPNPVGIVTNRKPQYLVDGMVRLNTVKEFLADVE